jgi:hypothetical protein
MRGAVTAADGRGGGALARSFLFNPQPEVINMAGYDLSALHRPISVRDKQPRCNAICRFISLHSEQNSNLNMGYADRLSNLRTRLADLA